MKLLKRLVVVFVVLLILLVVAAAAVPYLFKDKIVALVKTEINQTIRADVDFDDVDISLLRQFPKLSLGLDNLSVVGRDTFAGVDLARIKRADVALDLMSVIKGDEAVKIKRISLEEPVLNIRVLKSGLANYDIMLDSTTEDTPAETSTEAMGIALEGYSITDGQLVYDDRLTDTYVQLEGLNHSGKGNFTLNEYDLDTETEIQSLSVRQGLIKYLDKATANLDAVIHINALESIYRLKENRLAINALVLNADGEMQMLEEDIRLDLTFNAPETDFRQLWSVIPNAFIAGYENVDISGNFALAGAVKGIYRAEPETYPSFNIQAKIDNGNVKYPDLPVGINAIYADINIDSPNDQLDDMVIDIPNLGLRLDQDPIKARFHLEHPISDPDMQAQLDGKLDLARWAQAFPMEGVEEMSGQIVTDIEIDSRLSAIESGAYDQVKMRGNLLANDIVYQADGLPIFKVQSATADFTPQRVNLPNFSAQLGRSDVRGSGYIDNLLAYFSPKKTMTGSFDLESNYFDIDEWMPAAESAEAQGLLADPTAGTVGSAVVTDVFDRFAFDFVAKVKEIKYDIYKLDNSEAVGLFSPDLVRVTGASSRIGESDFFVSGKITNLWDYTFKDDVLGGSIDLQSKLLNLNDFMVEVPSTNPGEGGTANASTEEYGVVPVPPNIEMAIDATIEKLLYTDLTLTNVKGNLQIVDQQMFVENGTAGLLGGNVDFSGAYDTQDISDPGFSFKYDLQQMDFGQAFEYLNTFKMLAPIGKFITGKFNSTMILSGKLGSDMFPKINTLDAEGFLATLDASVSNFKPLTVVGNALNIKELKSTLSIKNVKSYFEINDGTVEVKPFDINIKDIGLEVAGTHSLSQEMSYQLRTTLPRKYLESNAIGSAVGKGIDNLIGQANKLGLNINQSENVNVLINLTGSLTDPKVGLKLLGADGEASLADDAKGSVQDAIAQEKQALKQNVDQKIDSAKTVAQQQVNQAVDSAKIAAQQQLGIARKKAEEEAKKRLGSLVDSTTVGQDAKKEIEDKLQKFNPFKKKKKDGGD